RSGHPPPSSRTVATAAGPGPTSAPRPAPPGMAGIPGAAAGVARGGRGVGADRRTGVGGGDPVLPGPAPPSLGPRPRPDPARRRPEPAHERPEDKLAQAAREP